MFSKLFKRKSVPSNDGKSSPSSIEKMQYIKVYELELSNMEGSPVYDLKHQLTIGSEIGNIVIADPSVSPRHATFILQDEVVSVIDHGSVAGTMVNNQKIPAGKYIILDEADIVKVGDLEIKLITGTASVPAEEVPEPPQEEDKKEDAKVKAFKDTKKTPPAKGEKKAALKPAQKKKKHLSFPSYVDSANSLVRVFAVLCDLLLSYSILVIFLPFDEFRNFLEFIPSFLASLIDVDWAAMVDAVLADYDFLAEMLKDAYAFFSSTFHIGPLLITFILLRMISTLLFGVSVSEYAVGIRPDGNGIWARIGGVIRVLIGVITWPFLIFDVPSVVSRRTLKEFLTFTNIYVPSKFVAILGIIFFFPLMIALSIVSPLMQGLEPPEPIIVNDRIDQRVKVKLPADQVAAAETQSANEASSALRMEMSYDPAELMIIPNFKFQGVKNKLNLKNSLIFYQKDLQRHVEMELFKSFDFKQLLGIGMKGNFMLYDKYPEIYNFVYDPAESNPAFRKNIDAKSEAAFANEVITFIKTSFSISPENALEVLQSETFLIHGLVDFKSSFLSLIEYKDFDQIGFIKLGNVLFMKIGFNMQKPFDLIMPLTRGEGRIFKVTYDKKENYGNVANKFYKFNLDKTNWLAAPSRRSSDVLNALEVYDLFSTGSFKSKFLSSDKAQAMYGYFFETSASILSKGDSVLLELWKSKVKNIPKLLEAIPSPSIEDGGEDPKNKLLQNFRDLIDALENNNAEYFGVGPKTV